MQTNIDNNMDRRRINLEFNETNNDYSIIDKIYSKYLKDIDEIKIISASQMYELEHIDHVMQLNLQLVSYIPERKYRIINAGRNFTETQRENAENVAIVSYIPVIGGDLNRIGTDITINEIAYKIIGVGNVSSGSYINVEIPYNTLKRNGLSFSSVSFVVSESIYESFEAKLKDIIGNKYSYRIQKGEYRKKEEALFIQRMISALLIVSLAVINMMMIFKYLMNIRKKEFAVMRIVGASENIIIKVVFLELFFILILAFSLAMLLNEIILIPLFRSIDIYLLYRPVDYVIIFTLLYLIACVPMISIIFKTILLSPARNRQQVME